MYDSVHIVGDITIDGLESRAIGYLHHTAQRRGFGLILTKARVVRTNMGIVASAVFALGESDAKTVRILLRE